MRVNVFDRIRREYRDRRNGQQQQHRQQDRENYL
jgi:hypothetical protein